MRRLRTTAALAALAFAAAATPAPAADDAQPQVHKIRIRCDGDDCSEHAAVFVTSGDEQVEYIGGEATWLDAAGRWQVGDGFAFTSGAPAGGSYLGLQLTELTPELRIHFGVPDDAGVLVAKVLDDSPASRAGFAVGDIVTAIDGETVRSSAALADIVRATEAGTSVILEVWRNGRVEKLTAAPEERPAPTHRLRRLFALCDEDEEDCPAALPFSPRFACAANDSCEVQIRCDGGDCECTLDGEAVDCDELRDEGP